MGMSSRFDYVKYDDTATTDQGVLKYKFQDIEDYIDENIKAIAPKTLALRKLEEAYMWLGKAIRDDQITRNLSAPLQEERNKS